MAFDHLDQPRTDRLLHQGSGSSFEVAVQSRIAVSSSGSSDGCRGQPGLAFVLIAAPPPVEALAGNPEIKTRRRHAPGHFLSVTEHRQAMPDLPLLLSVVHPDLQSQETPDVNNVRQF
jgi:hypothetical protein